MLQLQIWMQLAVLMLLLKIMPAIILTIAATVGVSSVALGPILGGVLTELLDWRWMFLYNVPVGIIIFVLGYIFIDLKKRDKTLLSKIDYIGILLLATSLIALLIFLEEGDRRDWFSSNFIIFSLSSKLIEEKVELNVKVFEKIFLDLQSDEIEFANDDFKILYNKLINEFQKKQNFDPKVFINSLTQNLSELVTSILIEDEIYQLHNWRSKNVIVKDKGRSVSQLVTETILTLRTLLINKKDLR